LVGLKPSRGRNFGDETKLALTDISVNGCVSRTVRDTARWLVATQAKQPDAPFAPVPLVTAPIDRSLRIRTYDTIMRTGGAPDVSVGRVFEEAMSLLGRLGHRVGRGTLPFNGPTAARALNDFIEGRFAREFERMRETLGDVFQPDRLEHRSATLVAAGGGIDDGRFATVLRLIEDNVAAYLDGFNDFDVWMTPTVSSEVVRIGAFSADSAWEKQKDALVDYAGYCWIDNFAGTPAITLPMGFSDAGLPVGIQFATRRGDEALLLALAFQLEAEMEWWRHKPPVWVGD
jgi:amidase